MARPSSIKIRSRVLIPSLLVLFCTMAALGQAKQESGNLKVDVGPVQEFEHSVGSLGRASMEAKLRGFIWDHWHQKRAGRIVARFSSIDSGPTTHTFDILLDRSGQWIVVSKVEKWCWWLCRFQNLLRQTEPTTTVERFQLLDRVEPNTEPKNFTGELPALDGDFQSRTKVIKTLESRSPDKYRLFFQSTTRPTDSWLF